MADEGTVSETEIAKLLMSEYIIARQEILLHMQHLKTQERYASILLALGGLIVAVLVRGQATTIPGTGFVYHPTPWGDLLLVFTITTVVYLILFSALASQFGMSVNAERAVRIEDQLNDLLRSPYFIWERLAKEVYSNRTPLIYKMPTAAGAMTSLLLIGTFAFFLPSLTATKILCGHRDLLLTLATYTFVSYSIVMPIIAARMSIYSTAQVRDDCHQLFRWKTHGDVQPVKKNGLWPLIAIVVAAFILAALFVYFVPHQSVFSYIA